MPYSTTINDKPVGSCPRCGKDIYEQKPGFFCSDHICGFAIWKKNKFFEFKRKEVTRDIAAALLKEGRVFVSGLYSDRTNKTYDAFIAMDDSDGKYVKFRIEIPPKGDNYNG
jgi:DNA topoisomerase-3